VERGQLNLAVVSINLGVGTDAYANAFGDPQAFPRLLAEIQDAIETSKRAENATLGRIALSAWSAGFVSVAKIMTDPASAERVDAVLVADGFFTSFSNVKARTVNAASLERFVSLVAAAEKNERLFVMTHSSIPTVDYASVEETVTKLLELTQIPKVPSSAVGPHEMHEKYAASRGSFHVTAYEGITAPDHIRQITSMGETLYPYLKTRWESPHAPTLGQTR
jgi:hypothetical protein